MRFGILGTTRAWRDDETEVNLGGPARRALLTLLLARPGEAVAADRLIDDLYGERPPDGAGHALQSQISRLRGVLGPGAVIEAAPPGYRLAAGPGDVDAHRFERLAEEGRRALATGDPARAAALLREATDLWRGPALADAASAGSVQALVTRLEERRLGALEDRIEADLRLGGHRSAVPELRELADRHPLRERLRGLLMRALAADGRQAEALVAFEETRRLLADELGADPSAGLSAIHRSILRGETPAAPGPSTPTAPTTGPPASTAPEPSAPAVPGPPAPAASGPVPGPPAAPGPVLPAPPAQLTNFVGRAGDLAEVTRLLDSARLVTLLGPGGAGKTRLAVEAVSGRSGVCFVELAPLRDGAELPRALLGALGLREGGLLSVPAGATPLSRLAAALADRPPLLVLDNCEHVVAAVAELAGRLLAACPGLRVLATSREPLGITGEHLWPVRPLAPEEAARLFVDRAAAVRPGFARNETGSEAGTGAGAGTATGTGSGIGAGAEAEAEAVRHVCAALDGLPLAIELAAARTRTHDVTEIAVRLDDRFRLLTRGSRTADARHRTLRAVVEWSWDLLSEEERVAARRLTVFSGGATARAAGRVCGIEDAEDVLDSLADKSLLESGGGRYRMLETIRAYCAERLEEAGEAGAVRRAHAGHFLDLVRDTAPGLLRAGQLRRMEVLIAEHENLHAALRWAVEAGEIGTGLGLLGAMSGYLWMRGMRSLMTAQAVALLEAIGSDPDPAFGDDYVMCALTAAAGEAGRDAWERHRRAAEAIVLRPDRPRRNPLVAFLWPMLNSGGSGEDVEAALTVIGRGRTAPDPWERAASRLVWGYPQMVTGDFAQAERDFTAAADAFRALGDRWGRALALDALAGLAGWCDDPVRAIALTDEALALTEELGADEDASDLLCNRGDHRVRLARSAGSESVPVPGSGGHRSAEGRAAQGPPDGGLDGARADYARAAELARRAGSPTCLAAALRGLGDIARLEGDPAGARRLYEEALERFDPHWVRSLSNRVGTLVGLGRVEEGLGRIAEARARYRQAVELAVSAGPIPDGARAVECLAGAALAEGDAAAAARLLGAAAALRGVTADGDPDAAGTAAAARDALGERAYEAAHREGLRLAPDEALRLAGVSEHVIRSSPVLGSASED
ncbi:BTAD domain-containing putative transcriptional regulator [Streptosporangium sp. NPDC004379]|uniref:AfsR/SARP family transcriptional regulator n=1 Tax=Streptosporangium sp. NPDC004379 TaxID=3366189 RepID=UPI0036C8843B